MIALSVTAALTAAGLAGAAGLVSARAGHREAAWMAAHPPKGELVDIEGKPLHLLRAGRPMDEAPAVVLIHGANGNLRDFTFDLIGRLESAFHVIALDRPGLGWSAGWGAADSDPALQARVMRQAVAALGVQRPVVVGHSYGGAVAMAWALQAEAETGAVVLLGGVTHPWDGHNLGRWYALNATPLARPARAMVSAFAPQRMVEATLASIFAPVPVPDGYAAHFGAGLALRRDSQETNTRQVNALLPFVRRMAPRYPALSLPIEALHGTDDTIVGIDIHTRRLERAVPSAHLTALDACGHMPHHSHPEATIAAIRRAARRAGLTD